MLSPEQLAAVEDPARQVAIVAPPGSGKTSTLIARAIRHRDEYGSALCVTFTNKAAREIRERAPGMDAITFHGLAIRLVQASSPEPITVLDELDARDIACQVGEELGILRLGWKDGRRAAAKVLADRAGRARYRAILRQIRAVDFDLLIDRAIVAASTTRAYRYTSILLDEQQDADPRQWDLVRALQPGAITMVGDPRQTIYSWRGADPAILLDAYASPEWSAHALTANYRSAPAIVELANRIAAPMSFRAPPMRAARESTRSPAWMVEPTPDAEAELVAHAAGIWAQDWILDGPPAGLILARSWSELDRVAEALDVEGVPFAHLGRSAGDWSEPKLRSIVKFLQLAANPRLDTWAVDIARAIGLYDEAIRQAGVRVARSGRPLVEDLGLLAPAGVGRSMLDSARGLATWAALRLRLGPVPDLLAKFPADQTVAQFLEWHAGRSTQDTAPSAPIWLSSVHGVKGLEAEGVAIVGTDERGFSGDGETRRLFFVAATRARDRLLITRSESRRHRPTNAGAFWS